MNTHTTLTNTSLMLLSSLTPLSTVIISPALPIFDELFKLSSESTTWVITTFILGIVIGFVLYAPISNRYGRVRTVIFGLSLSLVGLLLCMLSYFTQQFHLLLLGRLISGFGSCAATICATILIVELYPLNRARSLASMGALAATLSGGLGVTLGGFLVTYSSWLSCFIFVFILTLWTLWMMRFVPETLAVDKRQAIDWQPVISSYIKTLRQPIVTILALCMSAYTAFNYLYSAAVPIIAVDTLSLSIEHYGIWHIVNMAGILLGTMISTKLAHKFDVIKTIQITLLVGVVIAIMLLLLLLMQIHKPWLFFSLTSMLFLVSMIFYPNASTYVVASSDNKANASATTKLLAFGLGLVTVMLMATLPGALAYKFSILLVAMYVFGFVLSLVVAKKT